MTSYHLHTGKRSRGRKSSPLHSSLFPSPPLPSPFQQSIHPFPPSESEGIGGSHGVLFFSAQTSKHPSLCTSVPLCNLQHLTCHRRRCLARWRFRSQVRKLPQSLSVGTFFPFCYWNCSILVFCHSSVYFRVRSFYRGLHLLSIVCFFILGRSNFEMDDRAVRLAHNFWKDFAKARTTFYKAIFSCDWSQFHPHLFSWLEMDTK